MPLGVLFSLVVGLLLSLMAAIILLAAWLDRGKGQGQSDGAKWPWRRVNHPERERAPTRTRRQPAGASGVGGAGSSGAFNVSAAAYGVPALSPLADAAARRGDDHR